MGRRHQLRRASADAQARAGGVAEGGRGLFHLEEKLGIPKSSWVNQCKSADYGIWRFKILDPKALNLRIPSGSEYGAYGSWVDRGGVAHRGEWRPGGQTLGGANEAVIDQVGGGSSGSPATRLDWLPAPDCQSREGRDHQGRA